MTATSHVAHDAPSSHKTLQVLELQFFHNKMPSAIRFFFNQTNKIGALCSTVEILICGQTESRNFSFSSNSFLFFNCLKSLEQKLVLQLISIDKNTVGGEFAGEDAVICLFSVVTCWILLNS